MKITRFLKISCIFLLLLLNGCQADKEAEHNQDLIIHPIIEGEYGTMLPYEVSDTRYIHNIYRTNQYDPLNMGELALDLAKKYFNPSYVYVKEGTVLNNTDLEDTNLATYISTGLLRYKSNDNPNGLNPEKGIAYDNGEGVMMVNPIMVSDVYEMDYCEVVEGECEYVGFTFIIVLNSQVLYYEPQRDDDGNIVYEDGKALTSGSLKSIEVTEDQLFTYGSVEAGQRLVSELRNNHPEVGNLPIHILLYEASVADSYLPGSFIGEALIEDRSSTYTQLNQEWAFLPSARFAELNNVLNSQFNTAVNQLFESFPTDVGFFGKGFFEDYALKKLELELNMQAKTYVECQSAIQMVARLCNEYLSEKTYEVEVVVKSDDEVIALIERAEGEEQVKVRMI